MDAFADIELAEGKAPASALETPAKPDRLPPMLFLAALIHGILIIGITFNPMAGSGADAISLDVTIVADPQRTADNKDADYLAQASQDGQGNTLLEVRPGALPRSNVPFDNMGQRDGDAFENTQAASESADQVLTSRAERELQVPDQPRDDPEARTQTAMALQAGVDLTLPLPQEERASLQIHDDNPRELVTSVDTRESVIAGYLDRWKRKIEAIGVAYFPEQALTQGDHGSPTLEVTIDAAGRLQEVVIRQSSGSRVLDQAALDILRRAAPFDPFPKAVSEDYDQLRFAYKWEFSRSRAPSPTG